MKVSCVICSNVWKLEDKIWVLEENNMSVRLDLLKNINERENYVFKDFITLLRTTAFVMSISVSISSGCQNTQRKLYLLGAVNLRTSLSLYN